MIVGDLGCIGDICQAGRYFFCGLSERTNEAGAKQLARFLREFGYTSILIDIKTDGETGAAATESLLHLKSGIAYLGDNRLVTVASMAGRKEFAGYDLVLVDQAETYAANCIRVNNHVLIADGYPHFAAKLRDLGYQTIALDMSEFQKMDGGLSCLSLRF